MNKLKPCPFCGNKVSILISDDEGNIHNDDYTEDPYSGLAYSIGHIYEDAIMCPIAMHQDNGGLLGVLLFDTIEEAINIWNKRI